MSTITRRGALGRLFTLGAAATAAVVAPDAVLAAPEAPAMPVAPALPEWLTSDSELTDAFERLVHALTLLPEDEFSYRFHRGMAVAAAERAEIVAGLRPEPPRPEPLPMEPQTPRAEAIDGNRIVTVRIDRLAVKDRRRVRRWAASLSNGEHKLIVHLRLGERSARSGQRPYDFLDVAAPRWSDASPFEHGQQIVDAYQQAFGETTCTVLCAHDGSREPGARTWLYAFPDGRIARYLDQVQA